MKIAQIGVGGWGKNHARVLSHLGILTTICDADAKKSSEYGKKYSVSYHTSVKSMIDREEFDAAIVCTPTRTHFEISAQLLQAKKHVFVEKPMTYGSVDGKSLASIAKKNNVLLTCGYIERFNPAVDTVKQLIQSKKYGELIMLEFHRENKMPPHIKDVGIIYDTAVHDIDTALWLFGGMPEMVFAKAGQIRHEHEDFASIMLGFQDNKVASIISNWITPTRVRTFNAVCADAIISSNFITQEVRIERSGDTEIPKRTKEEPLLREIQSFVDAVDGKSELAVKPEDAINVTRIAEAALVSNQTGVPIYLAPK